MSSSSFNRPGQGLRVDLQCVKNNTNHHTHKITEERLIIRRGQAFSLKIRAENIQQNHICITAKTGPGASEVKHTLFSFSPQSSTNPAQVCSRSESSVSLTLGFLSDAPVGRYSVCVKHGSSSCVNTLTLLFNPWCKDDCVYLPSEAERQEYIMNEQGVLYKGVDEYITSMSWDYGQFEEDIVDICLKLLDLNPKCLKDPQEDYSARCNPVYISRVVSAMINCNDDQGVLAGQWGDSYTGGVPPSRWSSSVEILRRWIKYDCCPVKYGQCWVFAAVMCTVLRCLGIPCRVVTNYQSAHDTDRNLVVDEYFSDYGIRPKNSLDSVWNFHVWVEAWMRRPDLSEDTHTLYDGWQVLDPTPQEKSSGTYCCGPAPVRAILEGHTEVKYDVPFVFAEVNADRVCWLLMADGSRKKILSDSRSVGQNISTKAVGGSSRLDITDLYKHREGSVQERAVYTEAVHRLTDLQISESPAVSVQMRLSLDVPPLNGADVPLKLLLKASRAQCVCVSISAQVMRYTGAPAAAVWSHSTDVQLKDTEEETLSFKLPFSAYGHRMLENNCIKVSAIAREKNNLNNTFLTEKNILLHTPNLGITVSGSPLLDSVMSAVVHFENPLSSTLQNCSITLSGSGLLKNTEKSSMVQLGPGQRITLQVTFTPYRLGLKKLMATFNSATFRDIQASAEVNVRSA